MGRSPLLFSLFAVLILSSCMTTNSNHGSALAAGKVALGAEASYLRSDRASDQGYDSYRAGILFGVWDNFNLGLSAGQYSTGPSSYYSGGGRVLWAIPNDTGSFALGLDLDYYFGFRFGNGDADDFFDLRDSALVQPTLSVAYAFSKGAVKPFAGFKVTPIFLTAYGGIDLQLGPLKPSFLVGVSRSTISPANTTQGLTSSGH
jgi:hypothetical protein